MGRHEQLANFKAHAVAIFYEFLAVAATRVLFIKALETPRLLFPGTSLQFLVPCVL